MMLPLLLLVAVCSATDYQRIEFSFRLKLLTDWNISVLPFELQRPGEKTYLTANATVGNYSDGILRGYGNSIMPIHELYSGPFGIKFGEERFIQKSVLIYLRENDTTHMKLTTDQYKLHITVVKEYDEQFTSMINDEKKAKATPVPNNCGCSKRNCACCEHIKLPEVKFDHEVCSNISYNAETIGIDVSIGLDGYFYTYEVSARNPPPLCFDIPGAHEIADICLAFKQLDLTKKHFAGCMEFEFELIHMRMAHVPLGCFDMPI